VRLKWTLRASRDLEAVKESRDRDHGGAIGGAIDDVLEMIRQIGMLAEHPGMGRTGRVKGTRELMVTGHPYVVQYLHMHEVLVVLRVLYRDERAQAW